jgi:hypothetical protein
MPRINDSFPLRGGEGGRISDPVRSYIAQNCRIGRNARAITTALAHGKRLPTEASLGPVIGSLPRVQSFTANGKPLVKASAERDMHGQVDRLYI